VAMLDFRKGNGGDYRLCAEKQMANCRMTSPFRKAGTDGKDLGADLDAIHTATSGTE
jgi:hypothetical protein